MDPVEVMFRYFWLMAIPVTAANGLYFWIKGSAAAGDDADRREALRRFVVVFVVWSVLPWLWMGAGIMAGGAETVMSYFHPTSGGIWVWSWHGLMILLVLVAAGWVFVGKGAAWIAENHELFQRMPNEPWLVRGVVGLMVVGTVAAEIAMWMGAFPAEF